MAKFLKALAYFGKELVEYNRDPKAWIEAWEARHPAVEKCTHAWSICDCPKETKSWENMQFCNPWCTCNYCEGLEG